MIICLGPFCIPIWNILLFLLAFIGPVVNFFKKYLLGRECETKNEFFPEYKRKGMILEHTELKKISPSSQEIDEICDKIFEAVKSQNVYELQSTLEWEICKFLGRRLQLPIIIDYSAEWCQPCKKISPRFKSLCCEYKGIFVKIDFDELSEFSNEMNVIRLPTFHFWTLSKGLYVLTDKLEKADSKRLENILVNICSKR
ncbi:thioredoxin domain-containing protein [Cryptosporidium felis]|nr:thioredoxin domain-containing protein [Cryptosporidium felis]